MTGCKGAERAHVLSGAERQARYRARLAGEADKGRLGPAEAGIAMLRKPPRGPSLTQRWDDAVAALIAVREIYVAWLDAMPEATRDTATGEVLQAMADLNLDEIESIRPPRGFGRD